MAFLATVLVLERNRSKEVTIINDYNTFNTVFGGYNNRGKFVSMKDVLDDFFDVLTNINTMDQQIFQELDKTNAGVFLKIFYSDMNEIGKDGA